MSLCIIVIGGIFDKYYDEIVGQFGFGESYLLDVIVCVCIIIEVVLEILCLFDLLEMQDGDCQCVLEVCQVLVQQVIVIIYGIDIMQQIVQVLGQVFIDKIVVLIGVMIFYEIVNFDVFFNFGFVCGVVQVLLLGVYVVMNGCIFVWNKVVKNCSVGVFELI